MNKPKNKLIQITKNKLTQTTKLITTLTIILITTSCATTKQSNKIALKMLENNNVILMELKKERNDPEIRKKIKSDKQLTESERRLRIALQAVIESNNSLKKRFKKRKKEGSNNAK